VPVITGALMTLVTLDMAAIVEGSPQIFKVDYHQVMMPLSSEDAASRLGVKVETVYAYVSRGVLTARRQAGSRHSLFDPEEVERLARRGRPRRSSRPAALDLVVETELTTIVDQRVLYRGRDACRMARAEPFEQAAQRLWTGVEGARDEPWEAYAISLPELPDPRDRIRAAVVIGAANEPFRADLSTTAVASTARSMIATMVSALPAGPDARAPRLVLDRGRPPLRGSIAGRLWTRLTPRRSTPGLVTVLNAALVVLADHELASSTLAARVAASVRADPFAVVLAGLGAISGTLHGGASALAHQMLATAMRQGPATALASALDSHGHLPGFGHPLYPDGDPRAQLLLDLIYDAETPQTPGTQAAQNLIDAARRHSHTEPNVDFALAVLSTVARMPPAAGEIIFTIARTAGWIAHAIEEYTEPPLRFRARATKRRDRSDAPALR
jgi:citrate synthase